MIRNLLYISLLFFCPLFAFGQISDTSKDSLDTSLKFSGDYRFRIEHDWNSQKSDGSYRNDRSRLRYCFRFGVAKNLNDNFKVVARIRTGNLNDQQGPHVTLGKTSEFGLTSLGFEKANIQYKKGKIWAWAGKNSFPFWKQHELLWNDNVFPEGIAMGIKSKSNGLFTFSPTIGHFIINSSGKLFGQDQYLFAAELNSKLAIKEQQQLTYNFKNLFFHNVSTLPDGKGDSYLNYNIFVSSLSYQMKAGNKQLSIGADWFQNTSDYTNRRAEMNEELMGEKTGFVAYLKYGQLKSKGDFSAQFYYANIGKYAVVDYFAQNDWARWDYSGAGATGSRLSNFKGIEARIGYKVANHTRLVLRVYNVDQLISTNSHLETGSRIRLDLDTKF